MSGNAWMFVDLLIPVVLLVVLIGLIATTEPDPARALHRDVRPEEARRSGRRQRRSSDRVID